MTTDDRRPTTTAGGRSSVVEPGTFFWNAALASGKVEGGIVDAGGTLPGRWREA
jgi:hypothetical protein